MNKPELPRMECNEEDNLAGLRNAGFHNNNLAAELSCRERQLLEAIGQLAAEKLRADTFREYLKGHIDKGDVRCHECRELVNYTPEEWAALALGGESQKASGESK